MSEKRQIVDLYKDAVPISQLNKWGSISRSNYYYKVKPGKEAVTITPKLTIVINPSPNIGI